MGSFSAFHWIIVLAVVFLLFGNRLPSVMGDLAKGIKSFKAGMQEGDAELSAATTAVTRRDDAARG